MPRDHQDVDQKRTTHQGKVRRPGRPKGLFRPSRRPQQEAAMRVRDFENLIAQSRANAGLAATKEDSTPRGPEPKGDKQ